MPDIDDLQFIEQQKNMYLRWRKECLQMIAPFDGACSYALNKHDWLGWDRAGEVEAIMKSYGYEIQSWAPAYVEASPHRFSKYDRLSEWVHENGQVLELVFCDEFKDGKVLTKVYEIEMIGVFQRGVYPDYREPVYLVVRQSQLHNSIEKAIRKMFSYKKIAQSTKDNITKYYRNQYPVIECDPDDPKLLANKIKRIDKLLEVLK